MEKSYNVLLERIAAMVAVLSVDCTDIAQGHQTRDEGKGRHALQYPRTSYGSYSVKVWTETL